MEPWDLSTQKEETVNEDICWWRFPQRYIKPKRRANLTNEYSRQGYKATVMCNKVKFNGDVYTLDQLAEKENAVNSGKQVIRTSMVKRTVHKRSQDGKKDKKDESMYKMTRNVTKSRNKKKTVKKRWKLLDGQTGLDKKRENGKAWRKMIRNEHGEQDHKIGTWNITKPDALLPNKRLNKHFRKLLNGND